MQILNFTPLHIAALNGFADIVDLLVLHDDIHINAQTISYHHLNGISNKFIFLILFQFQN